MLARGCDVPPRRDSCPFNGIRNYVAASFSIFFYLLQAKVGGRRLRLFCQFIFCFIGCNLLIWSHYSV